MHTTIKKILCTSLLIICNNAGALTVSMAYETQVNPACPDSTISELKNGCEVLPDVLWRGAKPNSEHITFLMNQGVKSIINLQLLNSDEDSALKAKPANNHGELWLYRVKDWEPLVIVNPNQSDENIAKFLNVMRSAPKPAYVHCRAGRNRTGVMVAAYRIFEQGWAIEDAIAEMEQFKGEWKAADVRYFRKLTPERIQAIKTKSLESYEHHLSVVRCDNGECSTIEPTVIETNQSTLDTQTTTPKQITTNPSTVVDP